MAACIATTIPGYQSFECRYESGDLLSVEILVAVAQG